MKKLIYICPTIIQNKLAQRKKEQDMLVVKLHTKP